MSDYVCSDRRGNVEVCRRVRHLEFVWIRWKMRCYYILRLVWNYIEWASHHILQTSSSAGLARSQWSNTIHKYTNIQYLTTIYLGGTGSWSSISARRITMFSQNPSVCPLTGWPSSHRLTPCTFLLCDLTLPPSVGFILSTQCRRLVHICIVVAGLLHFEWTHSIVQLFELRNWYYRLARNVVARMGAPL